MPNTGSSWRIRSTAPDNWFEGNHRFNAVEHQNHPASGPSRNRQSAVAAPTPAAPGESYLSTRFYVGFDLGRKSSHSAIVVLEKTHITTKDRDPVTWAWIHRAEIHLRRAERLPLKLSYPDIADRLRPAIRLLPNTKDVTLVLDATGCGAPFLDILRKERLDVLEMPVMITSAGLPSYSTGTHRISKTDLMGSLNM